MEQLVTIKLFGQPYTFKAALEDRRAKEVADYLVKEVTNVELQQSEGSSSVNKIAVLLLAALNIANENLDLKRTNSILVQDVSERSRKIIRNLDSILV